MSRVLLAFVLAALAGFGFAQERGASRDSSASRGQSLYLPIYSHLLYGNVGRSGQPARALLSALVSIRNTDPRNAMRVLSARYYDTQGRFLRDYLAAPAVVPPLGTLELFVELHDESGGSGANFLIRWESDAAINAPLVEALHANMDSGKAVILTTRAVAIQD